MTAMNPMNTWSKRIVCCVLAGLLAACASEEPAPGKPGAGIVLSEVEAIEASSMLPVVSRTLSPGPVDARAIDIPGLRPVFMIGDDSRSKRWLKLRLPWLRQMGALGLVVNVASREGLVELRRLAEGVRLIPATGDDLAALLEFSHYPVLITSTYIYQ